MENILFLDIDGVLNSALWDQAHQEEIRRGILIDREKVSLLSALVKRTGVQVILHSGWRFWYDEDMKPTQKESEILSAMLAQEGIVLLAKTPDLTTGEIRATKMFSKVKADEILLWLETHKTVSGWVVLEDRDLHNPVVGAHQIQTDPAVGLTMNDVEAAVKLLNRHPLPEHRYK